jgi:two-component system response regulator DesR
VASRQQADVAIIDADLAGVDGLTAAARLHDARPGCWTLILADPHRRGLMSGDMPAFALGFLSRDVSPALLIHAVRNAAMGRSKPTRPGTRSPAGNAMPFALPPAVSRQVRSPAGSASPRAPSATISPASSARPVRVTASTPSGSRPRLAGSSQWPTRSRYIGEQASSAS